MHAFEHTVMRTLLGYLNETETAEFATSCAWWAPLLERDDNPLTYASKALCGKLRHGKSVGIARNRPDGYWFLHDLIIYSRLLSDMGQVGPNKITPFTFVALIMFNAKNRFEVTVEAIDQQEMENHGKAYPKSNREEHHRKRPVVLLRTRQGHSIPLDIKSLFKVTIKQSDIQYIVPIVHGTFSSHVSSIMRDGLIPGKKLERLSNRRGRQAIHFLCLGLKREKGLKWSKVRENADAFIEFDVVKWLENGKEAYVSANGVLNIFETIGP